MTRYAIFIFLLLSAGGWVALHYYHQQTHIHWQLAQLTSVLAVENDFADHNAQNTIKSMEAAIVKNHNQPADIARLRRAEALHACVSQLVTTLRSYGSQLRHSNSDSHSLQRLTTLPNSALSQKKLRRRALAQLAAYADTLRHFEAIAASTAPFPMSAFEEASPVIEALADLSCLESEVLASQQQILQRVAKLVGVRKQLTHLLPTVTAESDVVAPGTMYRAQLGIISFFSATELKMQMACNGYPVPINSAGVGLVRLRAPVRPGPAAWVGTIRLHSNGRDTTFQVTVPYRVVRR